MEQALHLALEGTKHQRLTACYFIKNADIPGKLHPVAAKIVENHFDDAQTMAIIFTEFMAGVENNLSNLVQDIRGKWNETPDETKEYHRVYATIDNYFKDETACRKYYDIMMQMLKAIPKRNIEFDQLVFNWNKESLKKSDIVVRLAFCASALKDETLIDEVTEYLDMAGETYSSIRENILALLCTAPVTPVQKQCLIKAVANSESSTRVMAAKLVKKLPLDADDYLLLEDMLRLKKSDVRKNVIEMMKKRPISDKRAMVQRLLTDKEEEKRTAGLDILNAMKAQSEIGSEEIAALVSCLSEPTTKEQILINEICKSEAGSNTSENGFGIYDDSADYEPVLEGEYLEECKKVFMEFFPASSAFAKVDDDTASNGLLHSVSSRLNKIIKHNTSDAGREVDLLKKLDELVEANRTLEYTSQFGDVYLLGNTVTYMKDANGEATLPFMELWDGFIAENQCNSVDLLRMYLSVSHSHNDDYGFSEHFKPLITGLLGNDFQTLPELHHYQPVCVLTGELFRTYGEKELYTKLAIVTAYYLIHYPKDLVYEYEVETWNHEKIKRTNSIIFHDKLKPILIHLNINQRDFPFKYALAKRMSFAYEGGSLSVSLPDTCNYLSAYVNGVISKDFMYKMMMTLPDAFRDLSLLIRFIRESNKQVSGRNEGRYINRFKSELAEKLLGHSLSEDTPFSDKDRQTLAITEECYEKISTIVLNTELVRGDSETVFSKRIFNLKRVYGVKYFVRILSALGNEKLVRSSYFNYYGGGNRAISKQESLSHLLQSCIPDVRDGETVKQQAALLKTLLKGTDITEARLIEAAMYSPEWIAIVGESLGWEGFTSCCYYFMAHMNESFDAKRQAMIAKYTPLSEEELNDGAFDLDWFTEVYHTLGQTHFDTIYKAAKYISDGSKHSRARKYADAATGKLDTKKVEAEINAKRNKDLLMAYGIIPVASHAMYKEKYSFLQQFLKESRQFGAQRRVSEKKATEMAIKNLSISAGFADETRFVLRMEGEIASELIGYFSPMDIDDVTVYLKAGEAGKIEIVCEKAGKTLKSIPAKLKKKDYITELQDAKKTLTTQYRRTKKLFEESMEEEAVFTVSELLEMGKNPAITGLINSLIFKSGERFGFFDEFCDADDSGTKLVIAHPYHLYQAGVWHQYQQLIFDKQMKQPFKQVFRELYVKTKEEKETYHSMRYAGNQIQPAKTIACLKDRRWIADVEDGLQKVYYKENIIACIYALADWFSPADIEAPTLEWVVFYNRKTYKELKIGDIPDILFSEVMRDVDLAVSVAHAGGIDPEMSHSTVEMRRVIAEFTLPLFKLTNVSLTDTHAVIEGKRAGYTIHLGSGVIHKMGGPMINVLPVHSQHRGRIFLPFVDDDPKTAEIISKIVMFAEDDKIKDPYILEQI